MELEVLTIVLLHIPLNCGCRRSEATVQFLHLVQLSSD